ncbi:hypothetical protein IQ22_02159 [Pseudomonas duriflava]|uniref:Uncharacterized protein n=1 Tax=Pseudomonas duriflava TaxID=459528 RepID=A0A562QE34_9PSED|nr:hypothetical protein [Pseudomonas duriflava]TWI54296.1 hypothetical protein IQ22_02159 [Pseudomonas duriflava]
MPNKVSISSPLELLEELSGSLLVNFETACAEVSRSAEENLSYQKKRHETTLKKLNTAQADLEHAMASTKAKAVEKAEKKIAKYTERLDKLNRKQSGIQHYLDRLNQDIAESVNLVKSIHAVRDAATHSLQKRKEPGADEPAPQAVSH